MADQEDPLVAFKFGLEIEGKLTGYFNSVSGIGSESEVIEQKISDPNTGETLIRKIPGRLTWTEITLKRGVTSNIDVWTWRQDVVDGKIDDVRFSNRVLTQEEILILYLENGWTN